MNENFGISELRSAFELILKSLEDGQHEHISIPTYSYWRIPAAEAKGVYDQPVPTLADYGEALEIVKQGIESGDGASLVFIDSVAALLACIVAHPPQALLFPSPASSA